MTINAMSYDGDLPVVRYKSWMIS